MMLVNLFNTQKKERKAIKKVDTVSEQVKEVLTKADQKLILMVRQ